MKRWGLGLFLVLGIVLVLAACSSDTMNDNATADNANAANAANPEITPETELVITATNYSFDQEEYHVKKGVPVKIIFKNESGNHGLLVPELNLLLNRKTSSTVIIPDKAGTYEMTCAVMCGSGHSTMKAKIVVE
ncbi:cupredoxin domain-containing protein [Paenibacillus sp. NFR01]|uniref:cupredoxin domain-containing protein n=1 Tax=Paenibacillus sp. NFR01 TaxID=1566279 RepID=UPI0008B2570F|nr:cupredoxin domain-containing protein [Paenibacillus sp. NFR01]SET87417.1 cytochrome c oxidase subunit 2 [Paenibacillus sp. NFR01]